MRSQTFTVFCSFVFLVATLNPPTVAAQDAIVTFYSNGSFATSNVPGAKHGVYYGGIYDGNQFLFSFRDGFFVKNNRFVIISLAPGLHTFSASYGSHPSKDTAFPVTLEAGKKYFIRAQSESSGIVLIEFEKGRLDQVTCEVAHEETVKAKPLEKTPYLTGHKISAQSVPSCP